MNTTTAGNAPAIDTQETCPAGGCEWEMCDESFDHEFGTEQIHYEECRLCGATRALEPDWTSYDPPDLDDVGFAPDSEARYFEDRP